MSMVVGLYPEKLQSWIEGKLALEYFFLETQLLEVYYIFIFSPPLSPAESWQLFCNLNKHFEHFYLSSSPSCMCALI